MNIPDEMTIALSKKKLLLIVAGSALFVVAGFWLPTLDPEGTELGSPIVLQVVGWASIVFFGLCGVVGTIKLFDRKPGLQFTKMGVIDNASGVSAGLILWSDIVGTEVYEVAGQRTLVIKVIDPDRYIGKGNPLKRWTTMANLKLCGSPVTISSNTLKTDFDELVDVLNAYIARYGAKA